MNFGKRLSGATKVVTVGAAVLCALSVAAPAQAEEAGLPMRVGTLTDADGTVTTVESPDYGLASNALLRAKARDACKDGWLCVFEHPGTTGNWFAWRGDRTWHDDFSRIECVTCGPNKYGKRGTFNDQMSSFVNNTGRTWWWYFDANGRGERHNMNPTPKSGFDLPLNEADEASSIYSWG